MSGGSVLDEGQIVVFLSDPGDQFIVQVADPTTIFITDLTDPSVLINEPTSTDFVELQGVGPQGPSGGGGGGANIDDVAAAIHDTSTIAKTYDSLNQIITLNLVAGSVTGTYIAAGAVGLTQMAAMNPTRLLGLDGTVVDVPHEITVGGGVEFTGTGGIRRSALSGAISALAGSGTTTLNDGTVTTTKIVDANVTTAKIASQAVTTALLADANVTTAKIANQAVTQTQLANLSVGTAQLIDANVTQGKLANLSVGTAQLIDANVTTAKVASQAITTALIADANVTTAKIANQAVTTALIADANVTNTKLANMAAGTVKANTTGSSAAPSDVSAVSTNTASTFVLRDGSARFQASDPSAAQDVATKNYVDNAPSVVLLATTTVGSAVSQVDLAFTSGYVSYKVILSDVRPTTGGDDLWARFSEDGGSTFKSGATDYKWVLFVETSNAASGVAGSNGDAKMILSNFGIKTSTTGSHLTGEIDVYNPAGTTHNKHLHYVTYHERNSDTATGRNHGGGTLALDTNAVTHIRFLMSTGTIAGGTFRMYGYK